MKDKVLIIDTKLTLIDYISLIDALVDGYFDVDGNYQPHIGMANAMRLFYNLCVKKSIFDNTIPHDFSDIILVEKLASCDEFILQFNNAISLGSICCIDFTFGYAYNQAMEIVQVRNDPMYKMSNDINVFLNSLLSLISNVMTQENIDITRDLANDIKSGKLDFSKIMMAYANSPEFEKAISGPKDTQAHEDQKTNIVPMHKE